MSFHPYATVLSPYATPATPYGPPTTPYAYPATPYTYPATPYPSGHSNFEEEEARVEKYEEELVKARQAAAEAKKAERQLEHQYQSTKETFQRRSKLERNIEMFYLSRGLPPPSYAVAMPPATFASSVTTAPPVVTPSPESHFVPTGPSTYMAPTPMHATPYPGGAYATPGYTTQYWLPPVPAPAYPSLSPPPPNFSIAPESTYKAAEVKVDKWTTGKTSTLIQNERRPHDLNSQRSTVHIHPMLSSVDGKTYPLIVDLARRRKDVTSIAEPGTRWNDAEILSQPATLPRVTRLRLISPKVALPIEIISRGGVTVHLMFFRSNP